MSINLGEYQISKPIVKPLVETLEKSHGTYIVKINDIGTASFKDVRGRFQNHNNKPLQNRETNQISSEGIVLQTHKNPQPNTKPKTSIKASIHNYKKKFEEIFKSQKHNQVKIVPHQNHTTTHRQSHFQYKNRDPKAGTQWSKYKQQRNRIPNHSALPGPGAYDITHQYRSLEPKPYFISTSSRDLEILKLKKQQNTQLQLSLDLRNHSRDRENVKIEQAKIEFAKRMLPHNRNKQYKLDNYFDISSDLLPRNYEELKNYKYETQIQRLMSDRKPSVIFDKTTN